MVSLPRSRPALVAIAAAVAVLLVAGFLWFRPDALFTDRTVEEELDPELAAALDASPGPVSSATSPSSSPSPDDSSPSRSSTPTSRAPSPSTSAGTTVTPTPTPSPEPRASSSTPSPEPAEPSQPEVLARGEWISLEHDTTGSVALVDDDGDLRVVLTDLATSNGPDLHVILSPKAGVAGDWYGYDDGATYLGGLKGNRGTQVYDVSDDLDPAEVASIVIWCERFSVGFGAANLA